MARSSLGQSQEYLHSASFRSFELPHFSSFPCPTVLPLPTTGKDPSTPIRRPLLVSGNSEPGSSFAIKCLQKEKQTFKYVQLLMDNVTALMFINKTGRTKFCILAPLCLTTFGNGVHRGNKGVCHTSRAS